MQCDKIKLYVENPSFKDRVILSVSNRLIDIILKLPINDKGKKKAIKKVLYSSLIVLRVNKD